MTIRDLTWSQGTLTTRGGRFAHDAFAEWVDLGPPLQRMELHEDELMSAGELYGIQDLLAAARRRGAEVIVTPPSPEAQRERERHRHRDRSQPFSRSGWTESESSHW